MSGLRLWVLGESNSCMAPNQIFPDPKKGDAGWFFESPILLDDPCLEHSQKLYGDAERGSLAFGEALAKAQAETGL